MAKKQRSKQKVSFWEMVRDVLIASMAKGIFVPASIVMIIMVMLVKMPSEDVGILAKTILGGLGNNSGIGYITTVAALGGWYWHAKYQRRTISNEMDRLANERNKYQTERLGSKAKSSK